MFYLLALLNRLDFQLFYFLSVQNVHIKVVVILYIINAACFGTQQGFRGAGLLPLHPLSR